VWEGAHAAALRIAFSAPTYPARHAGDETRPARDGPPFLAAGRTEAWSVWPHIRVFPCRDTVGVAGDGGGGPDFPQMHTRPRGAGRRLPTPRPRGKCVDSLLEPTATQQWQSPLESESSHTPLALSDGFG
jgi:hypothetical protein